jgi:hypothetical protein
MVWWPAAIWFLLVFQNKMEGFKTFTDTAYTLFRILLGEFDFESMALSSPRWGPVAFFSFVVLVLFVLLNMFIAIISDAFEATKAEIQEQSRRHASRSFQTEVLAVFLEHGLYKIPGVGRLVRLCVRRGVRYVKQARRRQKLQLINQRNLGGSSAKSKMGIGAIMDLANHDEDDDGELSAEELVVNLVGMGFDRETVIELVTKVDADHSGNISSEEAEELEALLREEQDSSRQLEQQRAAKRTRAEEQQAQIEELMRSNAALVAMALGGAAAGGGGRGGPGPKLSPPPVTVPPPPKVVVVLPEVVAA